MAANSSSPRRGANLRTIIWYAADRSSRPPLWREIAHDVIRRAMAERRECIRLLVVLAVAAAILAAVVVVMAVFVPPSFLTPAAVALGWFARRPRRPQRPERPAAPA